MAGSTTLRVLAWLLTACCVLAGGLAQGRDPYSHTRDRRNDDYRPGKDRPRNITLEAYNATAILARWLPPRTAKSCAVSRYIIRMKYEGQEQSSADRVLGTETSVLLTDMRPDSRYLVRLVAVGCRGKSPPTKWVRTRTPALPGGVAHYRTSRSESTVPGKPTRVRTRTLTDSIILSWEPPNDNILIRGYMVGYGEAVPDVNWQYVDDSTRTFTIRNLKPSSQYVISLRAFNNFGKGLVVYDLVYTREDMGPTVGPLAAPIGLRSRVLSPRTVWLEWTDPSLGGAQKITDDRYYTVTFSEMPVGETRSLTVKALNVVIYDLTPSTTYEFRVKTRKEEETTAYGISVYNTTFDSAPDTPPRMLTIVPSNASTSAVSVSWLPPEKPNGLLTGYLIFYAEETGQDDPEEWTIEGVLGDIYHVNIEGFDPQVTYLFKIQARNAKGYSPISPVLTYCRQRMEGPETSPASLEVHPSNTSTTAVLVTWQPPERPNGTVLQYAISYQEAHGPGVLGEVWGIKRAPADVRHLFIEGIRSDRTYNFRIQARKADRYGPVSSVIVYRRPPEEPKEVEIEIENESTLAVEEEDSNMLDDEASEDQSQGGLQQDKELPKPQFFKAPLDMEEDAEPEMNRRHSLNEKDPERNGSQWSPPTSLRSLMRHHVSAVLTWDQPPITDSSRSIKYELKYVRQGHHRHVMTQHSTVPIFLLDNLVPNARYNYTITMHDGDTLLWSFQGTLDTVDAA